MFYGSLLKPFLSYSPKRGLAKAKEGPQNDMKSCGGATWQRIESSARDDEGIL